MIEVRTDDRSPHQISSTMGALFALRGRARTLARQKLWRAGAYGIFASSIVT
jgi:hypothetical protein